MTRAVDPERERLSQEFHQATLAGYRHLVRTIRYKAKSFLHMVTMDGGEATAHTLLASSTISDGFERLRQENMLNHSIEALVLDPHYLRLFNERELHTARDRLAAVGFDVDAYLRALPVR